MAIQDYQKAQKLAEKQSRDLPSLERILRETGAEIEGQLPMGQMEIPLSLIEGTVQDERSNAFSAEFMPLLDLDTEFCSKWSALCDSVREVGVNEPIVVQEYMQRFYIVEGNKRVSVSKYFGSVSIEAVVTRIVPRKTDTVEYKVYSEFMEFHRISGIYEIEMKQPGEFLRLLQAVTPVEQPDDPDEPPVLPEPWDDELRRDVRFIYSVFESYYTNKMNMHLNITAGEAFLHYLEIYGFEQLRELSSVELQRRMERIRGEFRVLGNDNPTSHILNPTEASQKVALTKRIPLPIGQSTLQIAFLYPKKPDESAWVYNHEKGRAYIEEVFGDAIRTQYDVSPAEQAEEKIEEAIANGCKLIFTTSPVYHACSMRMAVAHPEVIILNCSVNTAYKQLRTYYLRIYEAKFITGIIAGAMTEVNRIGYIADYPVFGTPAAISAFALGVEMVNPTAKVYLDWSTLEHHDPSAYFHEMGIDLISGRDTHVPGSATERDECFGLYIYNYQKEEPIPLAKPVWNWGSLYEDLVRSVLIGAWKNDANQNETQALNYYWGMSSGAIDVELAPGLPGSVKKLVRLVQDRMTLRKLDPFIDPWAVYTRGGECIMEKGHSLTPDEIIKLDKLPANVRGRLPEVSELAPQFREFAKWHSIHGQNSAGLLK